MTTGHASKFQLFRPTYSHSRPLSGPLAGIATGSTLIATRRRRLLAGARCPNATLALAMSLSVPGRQAGAQPAREDLSLPPGRGGVFQQVWLVGPGGGPGGSAAPQAGSARGGARWGAVQRRQRGRGGHSGGC